MTHWCLSQKEGYIDEKEKVYDSLRGRSVECSRLWWICYFTGLSGTVSYRAYQTAGPLWEDNLKLIPLGACAQSYQDLRPFSNPANSEPNLGTKGIQLPLADLLLPYIPEDYDIVVLSCAYGGTGFTVGDPGVYNTGEKRPEPGILSWGAESPYYYGMKDGSDICWT